MTNSPSETKDVDEGKAQVQPEAQPVQPQRAEAKEQEPKLKLQVARACNNPNGRYIGMSKRQRDALNVEVGGTVELFEGNQSLGLFTVGKGASELSEHPEQFTANVVEAGKAVTVKKAFETAETIMKLPVTHGIENAPAGSPPDKAKEYAERTTRRMKIIAERFPGTGTDEFMTVPTAVLNQITGGAAKVANISKIKVRLGGHETDVVMVPAGNDIGLTTKLAQKLYIPLQLNEIRFRIDKGVMVID
jgi:hypothetical protein